MSSQSAAPTPKPGFTVTCGYGTDRGLSRELNEDSLIAVDPVFAVADGMGGHEAGEIASVRSATAVVVQKCILAADSEIRNATGGRAGTTLSGVVVAEHMGVAYWLVMNIGDSRTYRLRGGELRQISVDHSEVQELVEAGRITREEATVHPRRHVVTRALGTGGENEADFWLLPIQDGDRILVCSDGLTGELSDEHMFRILSTMEKPQDAVDALIKEALLSGGRDNITAIVVDARTP
jgi:PPM family protein phosphatase